MIKFDSFKYKSKNNCIHMSAEITILFESAGNETYYVGTPRIWDDFILKKITIENYNVHHIFAHVIPISKCSRITDYKRIWGLRKITKGIADLSYETDYLKIYLGASILHGRDGINSSQSSLIVLIPDNASYQSDTILAAFRENKCDFSRQSMLRSFSSLCNNISSAIILWYGTNEGAELTIYGQDVQQWVLKELLSENCLDNGLVHRQPFSNLP